MTRNYIFSLTAVAPLCCFAGCAYLMLSIVPFAGVDRLGSLPLQDHPAATAITIKPQHHNFAIDDEEELSDRITFVRVFS